VTGKKQQHVYGRASGFNPLMAEPNNASPGWGCHVEQDVIGIEFMKVRKNNRIELVLLSPLF